MQTPSSGVPPGHGVMAMLWWVSGELQGRVGAQVLAWGGRVRVAGEDEVGGGREEMSFSGKSKG